MIINSFAKFSSRWQGVGFSRCSLEEVYWYCFHESWKFNFNLRFVGVVMWLWLSYVCSTLLGNLPGSNVCCIAVLKFCCIITYRTAVTSFWNKFNNLSVYWSQSCLVSKADLLYFKLLPSLFYSEHKVVYFCLKVKFPLFITSHPRIG